MYWQTRQRQRMGVDVTKLQFKNLLRRVSRREGNPGPRVTLARGFKVLWLKQNFPGNRQESNESTGLTDVFRHVKTKLAFLVTSKV